MRRTKHTGTHINALQEALSSVDARLAQLVAGDLEFLEIIGAASLVSYRPMDILLEPKRVLEAVRDREALKGRAFLNILFQERAALGGGEFDESHFIHQNFSRVSLRGARLQRTVFVGCALTGADLSNADLREATIFHHQFDDVALDGARFDGAQVQGSEFEKCKDARLKGASFRGTDLSSAVFDRLAIEGVDFEGAMARGALMRGVSLRGCNFTAAILSGARLEEAVFDDCCLDYAELLWAVLQGSRIVGKQGLTSARFTNFSDAKLDGVHFQDMDLCGADFSGVDLSATKFVNCCMIGCKFDRAVIGPETIGRDCRVGGAITGHVTRGEEFLRSQNRGKGGQ